MLGFAAEKMSQKDPRVLAQDILKNPKSYQKNPTKLIKSLTFLKRANENSKRDIPVYRQAIAMLKRLEKEAPKGRTIDKNLRSQEIRKVKPEELLKRRKVVQGELADVVAQIHKLPEEPEMVATSSDDWIEQEKRKAAALKRGETTSVQKAAPSRRSLWKRLFGRK